MQKIVAPLEKAGKDVFYDGSRALVENETNTLSAVVSSYPGGYVTRAVEGPLINSKSVFRPFGKSKIKYTNDFKNVDSEINFYPDIEAAKNIALSLSAQRSGKAIETYEEAAKNFKIHETGNTFAEKIEVLTKLFG